MKKFGLLAVTFAVLSIMSFSIPAQAAVQTTAPAKVESYKVAVIDVPQVVAASAQVKALKKDQEAQVKSLVAFIEKARKDVASITDADKKKVAEERYSKELQAKKQKMNDDYNKKLKAIDDSISKQIESQAKAKGYDLVLSKGIVLFGGNDITSEIIKTVK